MRSIRCHSSRRFRQTDFSVQRTLLIPIWPRISLWVLAAASAICLSSGLATAGPDDPKVPAGLDPGGVSVAHIDTGVNYTLPFIAKRLARDGEGDIIGYDLEDDDLTPFDAQPGSSGANTRRHGTSVASVLLREAPRARLQPYRYAANNPASFAEIVYQIGYTPARIVAMPLGGYKMSDWEPFRDAALAVPNVLFVVSAGNEGKDIDSDPIYPAAFNLPNVLVVASTDAFGRFPASSNIGAKTVHISTPAEEVEAINFDGARMIASGSSYAVPRVAALAARIAEKNPNLDALALKGAIIALAGPNPSERTPRTRYGWIAAPDAVPLR